MTSALADVDAAPRTRVIVQLGTAQGCQVRRIPNTQRAPVGWSNLARIDLASPWDDRGICAAWVVTERDVCQKVLMSRRAWEDMDPLYRGQEFEDDDA